MIKERKATWHNSCKESQKREEDLWTQAEELRTQGSKDDRNREDPVDDLRRLKKMGDEEENQWEKLTEIRKLHEIMMDQRRKAPRRRSVADFLELHVVLGVKKKKCRLSGREGLANE